MCLPIEKATAMTERFRTLNIAPADRMHPHHQNRAQFIALAREGRALQAEKMAKERQDNGAPDSAGSAHRGQSAEQAYTGKAGTASTPGENQNRTGLSSIER